MKAESRTSNVIRNVFYSYASTILVSIFSIGLRTAFVYTLGASYLGVSGLFSNVLGLLSFSELGIGTAINFSLYKPIAENDHDKICSLLNLYKKAYRIIAGVIAGVGIILLPFLKFLVNTDIPLDKINIYYLIFLFNTVSSYFVTYKTSYISALQKNYIVTNANTAGTIATDVFQIVALLLGYNYTVYLIIAAIVGVIQKVATVLYLNSKYPILTRKAKADIDGQTKGEIWKNVKALIIHKIGDISVHQTDNIIVSVFVNTTTVGLISNYTTLSGLVNTFTRSLFNSFTASLGNLIAKENREKQYEIFEVYDFLGAWVFGFVLISFVVLSQPLITLWLGRNMLVDNLTMVLFFFSVYLEGVTITAFNFKVAAGRFSEDKWVAFAQAIVNLVVSIWAVKIIGLPGVYVGTIVQRLIVVIVRPYIVYHYVFEKSVVIYYMRFVLRVAIVAVICSFLIPFRNIVLTELSVFRFAIVVLITGIFPNLVYYLIYGRTRVFKDLVNRVKHRKEQ